MKANDIRQMLYSTICEVKFIKKDGSERTMVATLSDTYLPDKAIADAATETPADDLITCWDMEANAWRSFYVDKVISIEYEQE